MTFRGIATLTGLRLLPVAATAQTRETGFLTAGSAINRQAWLRAIERES